MGNNIFTYVQHLEMLAFFSGYPVIFYLIRFILLKAPLKNIRGASLVSILPFAYALVGTLYLSLQISNLYPDYTFENIKHRIHQPGLQIWALLSLIFWIPTLTRRLVLSVLHSLVFFCLIVKDIFFYLSGMIPEREIIKNDMQVYTVSLLLNLATCALLFLFYCLFKYRKKYTGS